MKKILAAVLMVLVLIIVPSVYGVDGLVILNYGNLGDVHVFGDWTKKGYQTPGLYRPSNGRWYLKNSFVGGRADILVEPFAPIEPDASGVLPIYEVFVGDWNGDGITDLGLRNPKTAIGYYKSFSISPIPPDPPLPPPPYTCVGGSAWPKDAEGNYVSTQGHFDVVDGAKRVFCIDIPVGSKLTFFQMSAHGGPHSVLARATLRAPNGQIYPQNTLQGSTEVKGDGAATVVLRGMKYPWGGNVPFDYVTPGVWGYEIEGISQAYIKCDLQLY